MLLSAGLAAGMGARPAARQEPPPDQAQVVALGKALFFDTTLSNPPGQGCISCHAPDAGFTFPDSSVNQKYGVATGAVAGRFGNRKVPTIAYAAYLTQGVPHYDASVQAYVGGLFWDGRVPNTEMQAERPFMNPNEMNDRVHNLASPALLIRKVKASPEAALFASTYGSNVWKRPNDQIYALIARSIAAFEASSAVSPFSSKYDAVLAGKATFTPTELEGLRLATGRLNGQPDGLPFPLSAHCMECHGIAEHPTQGINLWTNSCYANLGVPRNPNNPFYAMTDRKSNPQGCNRLGGDFVDYGLGSILYPILGLPPLDLAQGDPLAIDGTFKAPTLRNVDKRPYSTFVKVYMHNGVFKSLKDVVHFYNTRNLTTVPGEVIDFTKPHPYAGLKGKPLWPKPEYPSPVSMINPQGVRNSEDGGVGNEQIGNLGLSSVQEDAIVAFMKTLSDGYYKP